MTNKEKRAVEIEKIDNSNDHCGKKGKIAEIKRRRDRSHQIGVAEQNEKDLNVKMLKNGKIVYLSAESKTNGGRIDGYLDGSVDGEFTIYSLHFIQKLKFNDDVRDIPDIIIRNDLFLNMLRSINAIKTVNKKGVFDGYAIQPSSKRLYNILQDYINRYGDLVLYDNVKVFTYEAFEGMFLDLTK